MSYGPGAEAGFLRDARADVGVRAAVPPPRTRAPRCGRLLVDCALDAESARVLGDGEELLFHAERYLHGFPGNQRQHGYQGLQLDIELRAEAAAEKRHAHANAVLGQPRSRAISMRTNDGLRSGMDGKRAFGRLRHRDQRLERVCITCCVRKRCSKTRSPFHRFAGVAASQMKSRATLVLARPLRCLRSGNVPAGLSASCTIAFEVIASTRRRPRAAPRTRR